jgi:hypothetical protein
LDLEDVVQSKVSKLDHRLSEAASSKTAVDLHHALRAISVDVITDYAFDNCYDLLDREDFGIPFFDTMRELGPAVWFFQQWPFLQSIALSIPPWLAPILSSNLGSFMKLQEVISKDELFLLLLNGDRNVVSTLSQSRRSEMRGKSRSLERRFSINCSIPKQQKGM